MGSLWETLSDYKEMKSRSHIMRSVVMLPILWILDRSQQDTSFSMLPNSSLEDPKAYRDVTWLHMSSEAIPCHILHIIQNVRVGKKRGLQIMLSGIAWDNRHFQFVFEDFSGYADALVHWNLAVMMRMRIYFPTGMWWHVFSTTLSIVGDCAQCWDWLSESRPLDSTWNSEIKRLFFPHNECNATQWH